jgi:PASTA domain/Bacterial Ig-like domain (group 3)
MRRVFLRLEVLAVVVVAVCLAFLSGAQKPARADLQLASGPGGTLTLSNDKEGSAILTLGGMRPGDSVTDAVTLGNTGTLDGDLSLSTSNLLDTPGGGGGALSGKLDLRIRDVTVAGSPVTVYNGKIDALTPVALGTLTAGASRIYEFRVFFPDAGPGVENAYQGSSMSVQFDWTAVSTVDVDPPETTITSGPPALSASPNATFTFTADEAGSTFECSLDGAPFTSCSSPATFNGLADGAHSFDVRATDDSTNTDPTPDNASWTLDATAPSVSLADPGSPLRGTVTLSPSADDGTGSGIASLVVQRSPAGAGTWTTIATAWNTTGVGDGDYDLRARATDNVGNTANSPVRTVTVDNTAPSLASSTPADGELVAAAGSLAVVADENLAGIANATIDGFAAPAPAIIGATATYTAAFADGPHTFEGELEDTAGNRRAIAVHFTVWSLAAVDYPWIEKNSFPGTSTSLTAANGEGQITVPSGAWSGAPSGDWLVIRIDPRPMTTVPGGFRMDGDIYDVTAHWALAGTAVHTFSKALDLTLPSSAGNVVPATFESGAWRTIAPIPSGTSLPSGWVDGFYTSGTDVHILTKHLSSFSLLQDVRVPTKPGTFTGAKDNGRLVLRWKAARDNSGFVSAYLVYANGSLVKTVAGSARSADMGSFKTSDSRAFRIAARDAAGNVGPKTRALVIVPSLQKLTLAAATARLTARGLRAGAVKYSYSSTIAAGLVISARSGVAPKGAAIGLTVSSGPAGRSTSNPPPATGSGFSSGSGGPTYPGPSYNGGVPTPGSTSGGTSGGTPVTPATGSAGSESSEGPGEVQPESFSPTDDSTSALRRLLGLGLLGGAFVAAGVLALRARKPRVPRSAMGTVEPLMFWDQRLMHAVSTSVRRLTGRF